MLNHELVFARGIPPVPVFTFPRWGCYPKRNCDKYKPPLGEMAALDLQN